MTTLFERLLDAQVALMRQAGFEPEWIEADPLVSECRAELTQARTAFFGLSAPMLLVDEAVPRVLRTAPTGALWSTAKLAERIAAESDITIGSKSLQNYTLPRLRETAGTNAARCWDAGFRKFRWVPKKGER